MDTATEKLVAPEEESGDVDLSESETGSEEDVTGNMTTRLTRKQVTCKQLRHRRQHGTKPSGRRAIGILSILQVLTSGEFFSELEQVSVAWIKTSSQPTERCEQYTNKYSTYRVAQHNYISSREHAWLKFKDCTSLRP